MTGQTRWAWASGHLEVTNVVLAPDVDVVKALLPAGLSLAPQTLTPAGTHPVVLMFGQHSNVHPWFQPPSSGGHYNEWIVATPCLEWRGNGLVKPCAYMSRLYLNSLYYVFLGWLYGYPKKLSKSMVTSSSYDVRTFPGNQPRVSMTNALAGPVTPFPSMPGHEAIASVFELPFFQRLGPMPWLASRMWFELETATVQPMSASFSINTGCAPGLPAMSQQVGSIASGIPGAFHLSCDWMLSRPYLAKNIPQGFYGTNPPE